MTSQVRPQQPRERPVHSKPDIHDHACERRHRPTSSHSTAARAGIEQPRTNVRIWGVRKTAECRLMGLREHSPLVRRISSCERLSWGEARISSHRLYLLTAGSAPNPKQMRRSPAAKGEHAQGVLLSRRSSFGVKG